MEAAAAWPAPAERSRGDHGDVVLLLGVRAGEGLEVREHAVDQLLTARGVGHGLLEAREAEHVAVGVVRLDHAVGVQQDAVAGLERGLLLLVGHARHQPSGMPRARSSTTPSAVFT